LQVDDNNGTALETGLTSLNLNMISIVLVKKKLTEMDHQQCPLTYCSMLIRNT